MAIESATDRAYYFDADDFAVAATISGSGTVYGILDEEYEEVDVGTESAALVKHTMFTCASASVTGQSEGTQIIINSVTYTIKDIVSDGTGVTVLHLRVLNK